MLLGPIVSSILLYSLQIIPICKNSIGEMQGFHPKCTRIITQGRYSPENTQIKNETIRKIHNVPTIGSRLKTARLKLYREWKHRSAPNYLNDTEYVDQELTMLDGYILNLQQDIKNYINIHLTIPNLNTFQL